MPPLALPKAGRAALPLIAAIALSLALLIPPRFITASIGSPARASNLAASTNSAHVASRILGHEAGLTEHWLEQHDRVHM